MRVLLLLVVSYEDILVDDFVHGRQGFEGEGRGGTMRRVSDLLARGRSPAIAWVRKHGYKYICTSAVGSPGTCGGVFVHGREEFGGKGWHDKVYL